MNRKGQALVEFVLILPIFLLIVLAMIDFGMILNKKNELENASVDVVNMLQNDVDITDIKNKYLDIEIILEEDGKYTNVFLSDDVNIITPGLNRIFGEKYNVKIERVFIHDKT